MNHEKDDLARSPSVGCASATGSPRSSQPEDVEQFRERVKWLIAQWREAAQCDDFGNELNRRADQLEAVLAGASTVALEGPKAPLIRHQFWCPRHGEHAIESDKPCSVMVGRCPVCIESDREYNALNVTGDLGPAAFSPLYRCNCQRANKRIATTGMFA